MLRERSASGFPRFCGALVFLLFLIGAWEGQSSAAAAPSSEPGRLLFEQKCAACHTLGGAKKVGPDLRGILERRRRDWLVKWISDPPAMIASGDPIAAEIVKEYPIRMPALGLSEAEIDAILAFLSAAPPESTEAPQHEAAQRKGELAFTSRTYFQTYEDSVGHSFPRMYERMEVAAQPGDGRWSFQSSGLIAHSFRRIRGEDHGTDELTYAFLRYAPFAASGPVFTLGRQYVFGGIAAEQVDGIAARWDLTKSLSLGVFGGRPVETEFNGKSGDYVYGGRVSHLFPGAAEIGISALNERDNDRRFREEYGLDFWVMPAGAVRIQGHSFWNNVTKGWMENSLSLRLPSSIPVTLLVTQINYDDAFSARTLNAFSPDFVRPGEGLTKVGIAAETRIGTEGLLVLDVIGYDYRKSGNAGYFGGSFTTRWRSLLVGASVHRMQGQNERLRYFETRAFIKKMIAKTALVVDAVQLHYDAPFAGRSNSWAVSGTAATRLSRSVTAATEIEFRKSPDYRDRTMLLLKLMYAFSKELR